MIEKLDIDIRLGERVNLVILEEKINEIVSFLCPESVGEPRTYDELNVMQKEGIDAPQPVSTEGWEKDFDNFRPECGKWKIDRALAKVFIRSLIAQVREEEKVRVKTAVEKLKYESFETKSDFMPSTTYPTAKPAHESNEIFEQHFYNQALEDLLQELK